MLLEDTDKIPKHTVVLIIPTEYAPKPNALISLVRSEIGLAVLMTHIAFLRVVQYGIEFTSRVQFTVNSHTFLNFVPFCNTHRNAVCHTNQTPDIHTRYNMQFTNPKTVYGD